MSFIWNDGRRFLDKTDTAKFFGGHGPAEKAGDITGKKQ